MSVHRYVIVDLHAEYPHDPVAEIEPGDWRVTVHDDGTVERVRLRQAHIGRDQWSDCGHLHVWEQVETLWADAPEQGDTP